MEQRYVDALLFSVTILSVFGLAMLWEVVKKYVKFDK